MSGIQTFIFGMTAFYAIDSIMPEFTISFEADKSIIVGGISLLITYMVYNSLYRYYTE
jgi:hypothetical protein